MAALREQHAAVEAALAELANTAATKAGLAQSGRELQQLKSRLDEKVSRDEATSLLTSKLDRSEARGILSAQEQLSASVAQAEGQARKLQDHLSHVSSTAQDAAGTTRQLSAAMERVQLMTQEIDGRISARKAELASVVKVVRLLLEDAEMRCAIDETEGHTAAEAADVLKRLKGVNQGKGVPSLNINGVTLHKNPGGPLAPLSPKGEDKVWYKSSLMPRGEVLGQRKRLLVNARHSWVGDTCMYRDDAQPGVHSPRDISEMRGGVACGTAESGV